MITVISLECSVRQSRQATGKSPYWALRLDFNPWNPRQEKIKSENGSLTFTCASWQQRKKLMASVRESGTAVPPNASFKFYNTSTYPLLTPSSDLPPQAPAPTALVCCVILQLSGIIETLLFAVGLFTEYNIFTQVARVRTFHF